MRCWSAYRLFAYGLVDAIANSKPSHLLRHYLIKIDNGYTFLILACPSSPGMVIKQVTVCDVYMKAGQANQQQLMQQPRQSALLRLGYSSRGAAGRGLSQGTRGRRPWQWRGAWRGTGQSSLTHNTAQYVGWQFTRGRRGWRGRGVFSRLTAAAAEPTDISYFRGLMQKCLLTVILIN